MPVVAHSDHWHALGARLDSLFLVFLGTHVRLRLVLLQLGSLHIHFFEKPLLAIDNRSAGFKLGSGDWRHLHAAGRQNRVYLLAHQLLFPVPDVKHLGGRDLGRLHLVLEFSVDVPLRQPNPLLGRLFELDL